MTHFQVNHDIATQTSKETIKQLEKLTGGYVFWLDGNEFGGRKDARNFIGTLNQDGTIAVQFDQ